MKKNPIFWIKFRHMFAHGYSNWNYKCLYNDESTTKNDSLQDFLDEQADEYRYVDSHRKVEGVIIKTVPKNIYEEKIKNIHNRIKNLKEELEYIKNYTKIGKKDIKNEDKTRTRLSK